MEDLEALSAWTKEQGGIKDQQDYNDFIEDFNIILKYLIEDGQIIDEDEAGDLLLSSPSTQLRRMMDSGCAKKNPKVEKSNRTWDIIRTFGIKASKITSSNKTEKIIDTITDNFINTSQPKSQQHGKPEQEETSIASDIGPKTYRTTTLIDNTYIEGKQGIKNQIVNKNKEEETSTNLAGPPDKVGISTELSQTVEENIVNQLVFGNSQQLEEDINQENQQESQLLTKSLSGDSLNQAKNKEEETIYLSKDIESVMKDLPGYKLMDEDFGSILPSITADKFFYELWIEGREKVVENEIGQWIYFDGWVPGAGTQPGLSDSGSGNMDQSWEPIKEQVKLGSSVQTLEDFIDEENLKEKEENQLPIKLSPASVKEITELSSTIDTGKRGNMCPVKFRIWNQERKAPDPGEEEKENQLHSKAQHSGNNSHQGVDHKIQREYSQKEKKMLETNYKIDKNQDKAKIKEVGGGTIEKQNQTTKKIIEEETVMKTSGGLYQQQKHFSIMTIYKSVLNKFKSVKQQTSQNPHSPLIKVPNDWSSGQPTHRLEEGTSSTLGPMVNGIQVGPHNEELEDIIIQHLPIGSVDKVNLQKKPIDIGQRPCSRKRRAMAEMTKDKDRGHVVGKEIQAGETIGKDNMMIDWWKGNEAGHSLKESNPTGWLQENNKHHKDQWIGEKLNTQLFEGIAGAGADATNDNIRIRIIMSIGVCWKLQQHNLGKVKSNMQEKDKAEVVVIREINESWTEVEGEYQ
ncbi:hypothetical protein BY996DRAFT_6474597 [Phakopsora pachyrhizi]|nr:hypothetical protein BY996DRAFT_6474597 [Phakopsora pachyrhizi]